MIKNNNLKALSFVIFIGLIYSCATRAVEQDLFETMSLTVPDTTSPNGSYTDNNGTLLFDETVLQEYQNLDPGRDLINNNSNKHKIYKPNNARRDLISTNRVITELAVLGFPEIWTDNGVLSDKGEQLVNFIQKSYIHGLNPDDYRINSITREGSPADEIEIIASKAFIDLTNDILLGRLYPKKADYDWFVKQNDGMSISEILSQAVYATNIINLLNSKLPQSSIYASLSKKLQQYKETKRGWSYFPRRGPRLRLNSRHKQVKLLRKRLATSGYLKSSKGGTKFDRKLKRALIKFQSHHGLNRSGIVTRRTRKALAIGIGSRIIQLEESLERFRWMPNILPERYIIVNTAGSELDFREENSTILNMRTVVGHKRKDDDTNTETPSFNKKMRFVVFNPEWYVPQSIFTKEFLPEIKKDLSFFSRNNYQLYDKKGVNLIDYKTIDWQQFADNSKRLPYQIRQGIGSTNALGRIKFIFPNRFNIYLHDTPSKSLFRHEARSYSHGCVRLARPLDLATVVLNKSKKEVRKILISGKKTKIILEEALPVYIVYITAWAKDDGTVIFYNDTYGLDTRMKNNFI